METQKETGNIYYCTLYHNIMVSEMYDRINVELYQKSTATLFFTAVKSQYANRKQAPDSQSNSK